MCNGNGSTCAGCDGVPWSNVTIDACGICGGGNYCVGCDGMSFKKSHFGRIYSRKI